MPCLNRITSENLRLPFGDGKHQFQRESACGNACDDEEKVCSLCMVKSKTNVQGSRRFDHGLVTEPQTALSHLQDSPWQHTSVKAQGNPSPETLEAAMDAQKKARGGKRVTTAVATALAVSVAQTAAAVKDAAKEDMVPKKRVVRKQTPKSDIVVPVPTASVVPANEMLESMDDPLHVQEVVRIVLRPFTQKGATQWRDSEREKIQKQTKDGKKGEQVGDWNAQKQTLEVVSDNECV